MQTPHPGAWKAAYRSHVRYVRSIQSLFPRPWPRSEIRAACRAYANDAWPDYV